MGSLQVHWNRLEDESWAEFFAVDFDDPHFDGLEGVFVVWEGGSTPAAIGVGQGVLRDELKGLRADERVAPYRGRALFATWAKTDKVSRPGVTRYLLEALKPRIAPAAPGVPPVTVNLPGRGDEAPRDVEAPPPKQLFEDLTAPDSGSLTEDASLDAERKLALAKAKAEAAAKADAAARAQSDAAAKEALAARAAAVEKLPLQPEFAKLLAQASAPAKPGGFFFGAVKPANNEERLVGDAVHLIMSAALKMHASDIHLEPQEAYLRVRFRIDGIMEEVLSIPHDLKLRVVSNIRVACGLDPEKISGGKPEDGRVSVKVDGREADLRLSTFPTANGDKAVLRVIPRANKTVTLDDLGADSTQMETLKAMLAKPQGLIIATGPTGSGKSTTLYASLHELNDTTRNIVTLEDPVERKIPGISQGLIQPKQGFGFAEGLRSILRQDPNIIMVGEIRDKETAEIALSAALTGHLLLTTLHTVSAIGAVGRLIDMGMEPFLISSALTAITAQRLARAVCPACAGPDRATPEQLADVQTRARKAGIVPPPGYEKTLKRGAGCDACRGTGYRGRVLVLEILTSTPGLRDAILRKAGVDEMRAAAAKDGMQPLIADGLRKAASGRTTLSEILRVVDASD